MPPQIYRSLNFILCGNQEFSGIPPLNNLVHSSTGVPCLDFLDNPADWMPNYSISYILLSIQV